MHGVLQPRVEGELQAGKTKTVQYTWHGLLSPDPISVVQMPPEPTNQHGPPKLMLLLRLPRISCLPPCRLGYGAVWTMLEGSSETIARNADPTALVAGIGVSPKRRHLAVANNKVRRELGAAAAARINCCRRKHWAIRSVLSALVLDGPQQQAERAARWHCNPVGCTAVGLSSRAPIRT